MDKIDKIVTIIAGDLDVDIPKIDPGDLVANGLNLFYFVIGVAAVFMIIISGLRFTLSQGDSDAIKKAKNMILYSVIGLVVVAIAAIVTQFIVKVF